ncbi:hypothetical protein N2605_26020 [Bradyrhizobium yuanmingense]|uniref:hypothetical protein n=1 Tax=Bradyrhizobium yuanmingense TaxID=108015 RepID=UPI0021A854CE|nr:hypothetical protein [Bradyrhizobium sp. CB1024]UWU83012.1 hypothetical protein N2605_26020 [Bradyrhizobium sp. CB1024]
MRNSFDGSHHGSAKSCAMCGGKFALIRIGGGRPFAPRNAFDRFKARREAYQKWASRVADG